MVMENPMHVTMVMDEPLTISGAIWATRLENNGESGTTDIPHMKRKSMKTTGKGFNKNTGDSKQHKHETIRNKAAVLPAPNFCESMPPNTHAGPPEAMTRNEYIVTLR